MYPTAAGVRNIADTTMRYVPSLYSGKMLEKFYAKRVVPAICNQDYEGELKGQGDTLYIRANPDITVSTHYKGGAVVGEYPSSTAVTMLVDKGKKWAFVTDPIDDKQTDVKNYVEKWMDDAEKQVGIAIDTDVLGNIYSSAHASNYGATAGAISANINLGVESGTAVSLTKSDIVDKIVECGQVLDEQNIPDEDRYMVLPAWACAMLKQSDIKNVSLTGDSVSPIRNGRWGVVDRFEIFMSNKLSTGTDSVAATCTDIIFGHRSAVTFATQITENENLKNPNGFGILYRGLQVYGYKVVIPSALGWLFAKKGS